MVLRSLRELFRRRAGTRKDTAGRRQPRRPSRTPLACEALEARLVPDGGLSAVPASDRAFVQGLYRDVLHREADGPGLRNWLSFLHGDGTHLQVAEGFWDSAEHRGLQVDGFYERFLDRAPDAPGRASWVSALRGGLGEAEAARAFLTSEEYRRAHPDTTSFLVGLYAEVLGRAPDPDGLGDWQRAAQGGMGREALAAGFWDSTEHRGLQVDQFYATYLHRAPDAPGRASWVSAFLGGKSEVDVAIGFLTSDEYRRSHPDADSYLTGLYADVLGRTPDPDGFDNWRRLALGGMRRAELADGFLRSGEEDRQLLEYYYAAYLGRGPDADGLAAWLAVLEGNELSPAQAAVEILASDEFFARAAAGSD